MTQEEKPLVGSLPWHKVTELADKLDEKDSAPWMTDLGDFQKRFGVSYEDFCEILMTSPEADRDRYEKIRSTDGEAAIVWILERSTHNASR